MRSIWSGSISFGLVNIPVRLYSASEDNTLSFDLLHKKDLSPIRYARICKEDGQEIPFKDIVKGYEYRKDEYVVLTDEDFKKIYKAKKGTIDIIQFSYSDEINSIYFDKPYFLEPGKGADKSYALLYETLLTSKKVAIVKYVFRNKEHLGIIKPDHNALVLNQLRYDSEIRSFKDLKLPEEGKVNKKELDFALKLVDQSTTKFKAEKFKDEYSLELEEVINAKIKGVKLHKKQFPSKRSPKIHDISELLQASLKEAKHPKKQPKKMRKTG